MIYAIILSIHVVICVCLVLVVLLQSSKGGGLAGGSAFGGGADSTVFGGRGAATVLSKATTYFGAAFMITSLSLTLIGNDRGSAPRSLIEEEAARTPFAPPTQTAPPTGDFPTGGDGALPTEGPALPPAAGTTEGGESGAEGEPATSGGEETPAQGE